MHKDSCSPQSGFNLLPTFACFNLIRDTCVMSHQRVFFWKHFSHIKTYFTWLERLSVTAPVFAVPQYSSWDYITCPTVPVGQMAKCVYCFMHSLGFVCSFFFSQSPGFSTYTYELLGCRECISHNYWGPPNTAGKCMLSIINLAVDVCPLVVYFTIGNYCFVSTLFFHLCYGNCAWRKLVW